MKIRVSISEECHSDEIVFRADPMACAKYYECFYGSWYELVCPDGLHFSVELNVCDLPESAKCQEKV